jgi:hypothetical protein
MYTIEVPQYCFRVETVGEKSFTWQNKLQVNFKAGEREDCSSNKTVDAFLRDPFEISGVILLSRMRIFIISLNWIRTL